MVYPIESDLDPWLSDLTNKTGLLLVMTNLSTSLTFMTSKAITTLTLDLVTLETIEINSYCWSWLISLPSLRTEGLSILKLLIRNSLPTTCLPTTRLPTADKYEEFLTQIQQPNNNIKIYSQHLRSKKFLKNVMTNIEWLPKALPVHKKLRAKCLIM